MFQKISIAYVIALIFFCWGVGVGRYEVFPFRVLSPIYSEAKAFVVGDPFETTNVLEKVQSDFLGHPKRFLFPSHDVFDSSRYTEARFPSGLFKSNREGPRFFSDISTGAYLIYGIFEFSEGRYGALLVDHSGEILRHWVFERSPDNNELNPVKGGFDPQGFIISNAFYELQVQDFCGNEIWRDNTGYFHHSVEPAADDTLWVLNAFFLERRSVETGELKERFSMFDILKANPELHILEARMEQTGWLLDELTDSDEEYPSHQLAVLDPFHMNDVTPLPEALAASYPWLQVGDVVLSSKALNLVFIVRPETREILWHAYGLTSRQHDPDFNGSGTITIFDNKNHLPNSRIVELDPETLETRILVDGADFGIRNESHGNHTYLADGSIVFVDYMGRMFHVAADGDVLFEFQNRFDAEENLEIANVHYLTDADVTRLSGTCELPG